MSAPVVANASGVAEILHGLAAIAWPIVVLAALYSFRSELKNLVGRIRKWKGFGQELELDSLQEETERASGQVAVQPVIVGGTARFDAHEKGLQFESDLPEIAATPTRPSGQTPEAEAVLLGRDIEIELRTLAGSMGLLVGRTSPSALRSLDGLQKAGVITDELARALRDFWLVRNRVVHGKSVSERDVLRVVDIGVSLLDTLRSIPHEQNFVHHPKAKVFTDADGANARIDVHALLLQTVLADGSQDRRVYPTTRDDYATGQRVAWEWNDDRQWGESWYLDPDSQQIEYAWTASLEFVGRPLEQIV